MNKLKSLPVLLFATLIIGCATTPEQPQEPVTTVEEETPVMQTEPAIAVEEQTPTEPAPVEPVQEIPPQKIVEPVKVHSIYFAPDTFVIGSFNARQLDSMLREFKEANVQQLTITGHSAKLDNPQSEERAAMECAVAVAEYITASGSFTKKNITVLSAGASRPECSHTEITERGRNRRVEITYQ